MSVNRQATKSPLNEASLPPELAEFLARDTYSLLIKGESGTGKTLLALTILKALKPTGNLLYISTRTSPLQLLENYPWIETIFGPPGQVTERDARLSEGWETLVDARLDEPNVVFERITNVLMDRQAPTVLIDSWEALTDTVGADALRTNIRVLQTWRERAGARFIFVGEDPSNKAIDFMVEGVALLKERMLSGRRVREISLSKLHGIQISNPSYFFSLEGGTFRSFARYAPRDYAFRGAIPVKLDRPLRRVRGHYPSGYATLDAFLEGGYPSRSLALLELEPRVDARAGLVFLSRLLQDWMASGSEAIVQRPLEVDSAFFRQFRRSFAGAKDKMTVWEAEGSADPLGGLQKVLDPSRKAKPSLAVVWPGAWMSRPEVLGVLKKSCELTLCVGRPEELAWMPQQGVSTRLKISEIEGTLFLYSELPRSEFFALVPGIAAGNPTIDLEPVV